MSQLMYFDTTANEWLPVVVGAQGTTGSQGFGYAQLQGIQGTTGLQGSTGLQGLQGTTGTQGLTGIQGFVGLQGTTGLQGVQGIIGNGLIVGFNAQTGTTYTLVLADVNKIVTLNNASNITVTIPPSIFSANDQIHIQQIGTGQVTIVQGSTVTITSTGSTANAPKLRARYSGSSVVCTASNTFTIFGDVT